MTATALSPNGPFARTRTTWLVYAFLAYFAFTMSLLGPTMPFIATKLELTYTQMGYHFTLSAAGGLLASLIGARLAKWIGSAHLCWSAAALLSLVTPGITYGTTLGVTLISTFLYGVTGGLVILMIIAAISNAHPRHSTQAYTEANIGAGTAFIVGPALVGFIAKSALGWQTVAFLPLMCLLLVAVLFRGAAFPYPPAEIRPAPSGKVKNTPLPRLFWVFCVLTFLTVAMEWLINSWGASFLSTVVGYTPGTAASLVSVFAVAIVLGRLIGRRLLEIMSEGRLLVASLAWVILVFPLYWLSTIPALNVVGLFLVGLGIGNLAPLSQSGAMAAAGGQANHASARTGLFASSANLTMLQFVGILSDRFGIQRAYSVLVVLGILAIAVALIASRMRRSETSSTGNHQS